MQIFQRGLEGNHGLRRVWPLLSWEYWKTGPKGELLYRRMNVRGPGWWSGTAIFLPHHDGRACSWQIYVEEWTAHIGGDMSGNQPEPKEHIVDGRASQRSLGGWIGSCGWRAMA